MAHGLAREPPSKMGSIVWCRKVWKLESVCGGKNYGLVFIYYGLWLWLLNNYKLHSHHAGTTTRSWLIRGFFHLHLFSIITLLTNLSTFHHVRMGSRDRTMLIRMEAISSTIVFK